MNLSFRSLALQRPFDLALVLASLPLVLPLLLIVALGVRARLGSPVMFEQERAGRYGRPFRLVKFRTMTDTRTPDGRLLPDADRLTPFGRFLRSTSLDELPGLWNVVRGEMSWVGPRPLLQAYVTRYSPEQARRLDVRPGITGWAQIHGRNGISWDERFVLDVWYVDHRSLRLDLIILARTLATVLGRRGISADRYATMPEFTGSADLP